MKNLDKKKALAAKVLKVGKGRIIFDSELSAIKEAITKQDIRDLYAEGIIKLRPINGRKKVVKRKTRRGPGKIRKKVNKRKQTYVKMVRKLRAYVKALKEIGKIDKVEAKELRVRVKQKAFRSKSHLREQLENKE